MSKIIGSICPDYKPDWEETKKRYKAWWNHEYFGRCAISVTAPKNHDGEMPQFQGDPKERFLDLDFLSRLNKYEMQHTFYGGEAFPIWNPRHPGWAFEAAYLGADVELCQDTAWTSPTMAEGELTCYDYQSVAIDPNNRWWKLSREFLRRMGQESRGESIPDIGAFGGCGDTLAALRGTENLLIDLIDCPEYVAEFDQHLMRLWIDIYEDSYRILQENAQGSTCWFQLWSPGKFYASQCDFAYMISPEMFRKVFLPSIQMQLEYLDHAVYHVDGEGNFAHVDALCELPNLQALQILPGEGKPSPLHYLDVLKKVQAAGKNLHITIPGCQVEAALELLSAKGLFISTWCATEEEARQLIKLCEQRSKEKQGG